MSSPMITRMLGCGWPCCATAGATTIEASAPRTQHQMFLLDCISVSSQCALPYALGANAPGGVRVMPGSRLVTGVIGVSLLHLGEDAVEVVRLGRLQRRELF